MDLKTAASWPTMPVTCTAGSRGRGSCAEASSEAGPPSASMARKCSVRLAALALEFCTWQQLSRPADCGIFRRCSSIHEVSTKQK